MGDGCMRKSGKHVGPNFTLLEINRVRKPAYYNSVKQKKNKCCCQEKKEISDGYMAYLSTKETSAVTQNRSRRDGKKKAAAGFIHE